MIAGTAIAREVIATDRLVKLMRDAEEVAALFDRARVRLPAPLARFVRPLVTCEWHGEHSGETTPCCVHHSLNRDAR